MNIVDPILFQCKWQPAALALCAPGTLFNQVTYHQLERFIRNVGRKAHASGIVRGNVVALYIRDPILHSALILGLTKIGVITLATRERRLPQELSIDVAFVEPNSSAEPAARTIQVDPSWLTDDDAQRTEADQTLTSADDPCRVILTSGSTGLPKAVLRTNKHVFARTYRLQNLFGSRFPDCSRIFLNMSLTTGIGFTFLLYTLSRGGTLFMTGQQQSLMLETLSAYRVQAMLASPQTLAQMAEQYDQHPTLAHRFDVIVSTGSLLTQAASERVRSRVGPNVISSYGSTEGGIAASGPVAALAKVNGAVGFVAPGVTIEIVDSSHEVLPAGQEGLVRIRSECVVDGYLGDREATSQRFRDGCFYPGDIGRLTPNGMLIVAGREQALINLGGDKIHPERVETAITSFPAVREAAAFSATTTNGVHVLGSAIVWRDKTDESGLREHLERCLPRVFVPKLFVSVDAIPRTSNGKIDRTGVKEQIAQHARPQ